MSKLRPSRLRLRFNVGRKRPQNAACFTISPRVRKNTVPPLATFCIGAPGLRVCPNSRPTVWASLISHPSRIGVQDISRSKRFSHWPVPFQYAKCQPSSSSMRRRALRDIRSSMFRRVRPRRRIVQSAVLRWNPFDFSKIDQSIQHPEQTHDDEPKRGAARHSRESLFRKKRESHEARAHQKNTRRLGSCGGWRI
jgi:hypothetical protein